MDHLLDLTEGWQRSVATVNDALLHEYDGGEACPNDTTRLQHVNITGIPTASGVMAAVEQLASVLDITSAEIMFRIDSYTATGIMTLHPSFSPLNLRQLYSSGLLHDGVDWRLQPERCTALIAKTQRMGTALIYSSGSYILFGCRTLEAIRCLEHVVNTTQFVVHGRLVNLCGQCQFAPLLDRFTPRPSLFDFDFKWSDVTCAASPRAGECVPAALPFTSAYAHQVQAHGGEEEEEGCGGNSNPPQRHQV